MSDDDVVLSADERKRARVGRGGVASRRNFGDHKRQPKRRPWSVVRTLYFIARWCILTFSCVVGIDANAFCVLTWSFF